ncbi:clathrin adaptor complex small chain-domain-containing protein, partial [Paraphysoderma sedebokerense]
MVQVCEITNRSGPMKGALFLPIRRRNPRRNTFYHSRSMRFIHVANISGKSRLSRYYDSHVSPHERYTQALEVTKIALERLQRPKPSLLSSIFEFNGMKIVYRQFASLIFLAGLDEDENEFSALEFLQLFVEILQFYFGNVVC